MSILVYLLPLFIFSQLGTYKFNHIVYTYLTPNPPPQVLPAQTTLPIPSPSPSPSPLPSPIFTPTPISSPLPSALSIQPSAGISETDLWNALVVYRASHNRTPLIREESLCSYARKRVAQHLGRTDLDNHSGFQADADSGALFSETGDSFTQLGEVLAYLPSAQTATQVIEWGWDSSPAHREGLLSNDNTHACIVGTSPFFAGILGHR